MLCRVGSLDLGCCLRWLDALWITKHYFYCLVFWLTQPTEHSWNNHIRHFYQINLWPTSLYTWKPIFELVSSITQQPRGWRQSATHHVELEAVMLLHQTQHKHAETCNNMTNTVKYLTGTLSGLQSLKVEADSLSQNPRHLWSNSTKFSLTYFRQLMCSEKVRIAGAIFILCKRLRWGEDVAEDVWEGFLLR